MIEGRRILDVGCWKGDLTARIAEKTGASVTGVDILRESLMEARRKHPGMRFEVRDVLKKPFPRNSFDCITFLEVIEHVENPAEFVKAFHGMLEPDGFLVVSTPNAGPYFGPLRYFRSLRKKIRVIEREKVNTGEHTDHIYSWDLFTLYRLLYRNGFEYVDHAFAGVSLPGADLDFLTPLLGRFCTSVIIKVRKRGKRRWLK